MSLSKSAWAPKSVARMLELRFELGGDRGVINSDALLSRTHKYNHNSGYVRLIRDTSGPDSGQMNTLYVMPGRIQGAGARGAHPGGNFR